MVALRGIFTGAPLVLVLAGCVVAAPAATSPVASMPLPTTTHSAPAIATPTPPPTATFVLGSPLPVRDDAQIDDIWWVWDAESYTPVHITFEPGTWKIGQGPYPGSILREGTYTLGEGVLTWQEGWFDCAPDAMGSYEVLLSPDERWLSFLLVGDECPARLQTFATWRTWERGLPPY